MKLTDEQIRDCWDRVRHITGESPKIHALAREVEAEVLRGITGDGRVEAKPVAWAWGRRDANGEVYDCISDAEHALNEGRYTVPLYTSPPQQEQAAPHPDEFTCPLCFDDPANIKAAPGAVQDGPPFGTKRKAAMAIYTPPFKYAHGYIHDSAGHMVADQDGLDGEVEKSVVARVRGWGRIGYMPNPEELQDEVGQMMADALTAYYAAPKAQEPRA